MPRQRRDRETAQEEQESTEQQEVGTPQNKAKAGTRRAKSAGKDSAVAVVDTSAADAENNNNNNPLKKVVFIHHVLRFLKQDYVEADIGSHRNKIVKTLFSVPRFIHLRHVSSSWKETVEFYNPRPQENALTFCRHLPKLISYEEGKKMKYPSVQGSIVLRDIVGWLSNVEITNISGGESDSDSDDDESDSDGTHISGGKSTASNDDDADSDEFDFDNDDFDFGELDSDDDGGFVCSILFYFRRCLDSSTWKKKSGFEHHAAFVRDTLLWIIKFGRFKTRIHDPLGGDDVRVWCNIVDTVITRKKGEYFGFDTPEVRDAVLSVSKNITSSNIVDRCYATRYPNWGDNRCGRIRRWFRLVSTLTHDNEKVQKIFGTTEVLGEFIRLSSDDMTEFLSEDSYHDEDEIELYCQSMFKALSAITELKKNINIFATVELRDTMVRIFRKAQTELAEDEYCSIRRRPDPVYFFKLLHNLISTSKSNKKLFAVESVRDVLLRTFEKEDEVAEMTNEVTYWFFENLLALFEVKPIVFLIDATRKNFVEFARRIVEGSMIVQDGFNTTPETPRIFLTALHTMLLHNEKLFFSEIIDKYLIKIKTEKNLLRGSTKLFSEVEEIYAKMKKHLETEKEEKKDDGDSEDSGDFHYWDEFGDDDDEEEEEMEDLEDDYWISGDFIYWNCYYREREEVKQIRRRRRKWRQIFIEKPKKKNKTTKRKKSSF